MYKIDIKEFRLKNNLTQKQLASYFGIGQGFISQMENGIDPVPEKYIRRILDDPAFDSSMVQIVESVNDVEIPREVFDKMSQLIDTVCSQQNIIASQQRTIEHYVLSDRRVDAQEAGNASSADVG